MSKIVTVCGHAVERLVFQNQPVITLSVIDELHERKDLSSVEAFKNNKEMFIEGTDYFNAAYSEWKPLLVVPKTRNQKPKKASLVSDETRNQTDENASLKVGETRNQTDENASLVSDETRNQSEETNLEFPYPEPAPRPELTAVMMPEAEKITLPRPKKPRQQKLPNVKAEKRRGGHRGNMYLFSKTGYLRLTRFFTDPHSKQVKQVLLRRYFGESNKKSRQLEGAA